MLRRPLLFGTALSLLASSVRAIPPWSTLGEAVAIQGYDPVAYFTMNQAVRGSPRIVHEWGGMAWFFSKQEHRDAFASDPEKYAPQFGGFCTPSIASGKTSRGSGEAWVMHNGKVYLSYDKAVLEGFRRDLTGTISKAEGWWPTVKGRLEKQ
jgi:hypothetical protein